MIGQRPTGKSRQSTMYKLWLQLMNTSQLRRSTLSFFQWTNNNNRLDNLCNLLVLRPIGKSRQSTMYKLWLQLMNISQQHNTKNNLMSFL